MFKLTFISTNTLRRLRRLLRNDQLIMTLLAVIVGAAAAFGTIIIRKSISLISDTFFYGTSGSLIGRVEELPWFYIIFIPTVGGLIVGIFIFFFMPRKVPQGIADVIEASALRGGRMSLRAGFGAAIASSISIGVGGSVGREGPAVHLGSTLGAWVAERLHLTRSMSRVLLGCGAAAAVAASFNAPIAGALFAHEVIVGHFALSAFAPIVIASVVGTIISRNFFGDFPAFTVYEQELVSLFEFPAIVGLGLTCGAMAVILIRSIMFTQAQFARFPGPKWIRPGLAGFLLGLIALAFPQVLGVGYEATDLALKVQFSLAFLIALVIFKTLATAICIGGGFAGGVFTPSLMIGAMLGGAYGIVATSIFPDLSSGPAAYTIIGMGGVAAAMMGAPISTTLIIFELTDDYPLTIAVMIAVVISSLLTKQFVNGSYFNWQLECAGYDLKGGFEAALLRNIKVKEIMTVNNETINVGTGIDEIRERLQRSEIGELFVVKDEGELYGTITLADLSETAFDHDLDDLINAGDVARVHPPLLDADDHLETANKVIRDSGEHYIAVVEDHENLLFLGILHETDLMSAYNRALVDARREEHDGNL
ncbi:MAG: chloride channel protein [Pseudomonadota bacterium]|nr:chloride channel protein [Pseudomonadota bacterium]